MKDLQARKTVVVQPLYFNVLIVIHGTNVWNSARCGSKFSLASVAVNVRSNVHLQQLLI